MTYEDEANYKLVIDTPDAELMEYGDLTQPARPFVRPALGELEPMIPTLYEMGGIDKVVAKFKELLTKYLTLYGRADIANHIIFVKGGDDDV
jgi:hypothetical protein